MRVQYTPEQITEMANRLHADPALMELMVEFMRPLLDIHSLNIRGLAVVAMDVLCMRTPYQLYGQPAVGYAESYLKCIGAGDSLLRWQSGKDSGAWVHVISYDRGGDGYGPPDWLRQIPDELKLKLLAMEIGL